LHIGVIGVNHKNAPLSFREKIAKLTKKKFGENCAFHLHEKNEHYFIALLTCNRTEIYFCSQDPSLTHTYILSLLTPTLNKKKQKLYSFFGAECFHHLYRVVCGLDSAVKGETEIQGQIKQIYETVRNTIQLPKEMHFLFQKALQTGKKLRHTLLRDQKIPHIKHALFDLQENFFTSPPKILFLGASAINTQILAHFSKKGLKNLTICNRSCDKALVLQEKFDLNVLPFEQKSLWPQFDCIIAATKAEHYLMEQKDLLREIQEEKLLIDLSVPRNIHPLLGSFQGISLLNIDQINKELFQQKTTLKTVFEELEEEALLLAKKHTLLLETQKDNKILFSLHFTA
jgi:glutamyl-tRNA reductase